MSDNEPKINFDFLTDKLKEHGNDFAKRLPILGNVVWLCQNSATHRYLFFRDIDHRFMPPLMADQFKLYLNSNSGGIPLGFVSWAYLSEEAEQAYIETQRIAPKDWTSGENLWLIDAITPYAKGGELFQQAYDELFLDKEVFTLYPNEHGAFEKKTLLELTKIFAVETPNDVKH